MPIQQGNYLDPAAIAQVKAGMTHSQVRYLLGTPMVPGAFDNSRWDYDYYLKTQAPQDPARGHVAIYFENNLVARVDSDVTEAPLRRTQHARRSGPRAARRRRPLADSAFAALRCAARCARPRPAALARIDPAAADTSRSDRRRQERTARSCTLP